MSVMREGRGRPTCDTPVVLSRALDSKAGRGDIPRARMLTATAGGTAPAVPAQAPPANNLSVPFTSGPWSPFWPTPDSGDSRYQIPDPPLMEIPVNATPAAPYVWMVAGEVRANSTWTLPELFSKFVFADRKDLSGSDKIAGQMEVAATTTSLYIPSASMVGMMNDGPARFAKEWRANVNGTEYRDIIAVQETQDRRWVRLVVEDRG